MHRQSGSRVQFLLVCLVILWLGHVNCQDLFEDALGSNSQLWKSFQDEMRTLEQAAHKVNSMLSNANHQQQQDDQQAKAAENIPDTTVLASPDVMKDGVLSKQTEDKTESNSEKKDDSETSVGVGGGTKQPFGPTGLNFGSLIHSLGFFKNLPEPWWKGKNVCVEKSEKIDSKNNGMKEENEHILIMGTGTFEHCKQTSGKYICTTVISSPQSTKTVSTTYQCCEGFRRQAEGCVQGEEPTPSPSPTAATTSPVNDNADQDAIPWSQYQTIDIGKSVEDSSFSSQSSEGNGRPSWLRHYVQNNMEWVKNSLKK